MKYFQQAMRFIEDEEGASAVEYALLVGLIAVAIVTAVSALGSKLSDTFNYIKDQIPSS